MNSYMPTGSNGDHLVDLLVNDSRRRFLKEKSLYLPSVALNGRQLCDLELLATGVFSPLDGFMVRADYEAVLDRMRLQNNLLWPLPVYLDVSADIAAGLKIGQSLALRDPEGFLLAIQHVKDIWPLDRGREADRVYRTRDQSHPGVQYLFTRTGDYCVGGPLEVLNLPLHFDFKKLRATPREIRSSYQKLGWKRIIGFQTRNPIHRPQFELTIQAMRQAKANLLLLPVTGMTRPDDFNHYTRVRCYHAVTRHYPPDAYILNLLPLSMRLAGPRSALLDGIIAKNYGCTHFIVGYDHASPGTDCSGRLFYDPCETHRLALACGAEIGIEILAFEEMVYLPLEDEYRFKKDVPAGTQTISLSGTDIRSRFYNGRRIPDWATFPEVVAELQKAYPPPRQQGFTIFFTGLSGAGKSTIARVLYARFLEIGERPVTLLDGDIVRHNLSSELDFSREHRDINVRRIGFVAGEITKNRGIAICAPIAPYAATRREVRDGIKGYGGFIEVYVSTPLEECERRDRKGVYAKARAGLIKGFTGVNDPYEVPEAPDVEIDTTDLTPDEAAQEILLYLGQRGFI